jgi:hypothetical protein
MIIIGRGREGEVHLAFPLTLLNAGKNRQLTKLLGSDSLPSNLFEKIPAYSLAA